jgi:hypothetical protein
MGTNTLASYDTTGIVLTSGGAYLSPFTITQTGTVAASFGANGVYSALTNPSLLNEGLINGGFNGVNFTDGGTVANSGGATISAVNTAVYIAATYGLVLNAGVVNGGSFDGIFLGDGGSVTNARTGSIYGHNDGIDVRNGAATVTNFGTISGPNYQGVDLGAGGSLTNSGPSATISGNTGVRIGDFYGTVTNTGTITGAGDGMYFLANGYVSNSGPSSDISGFTGIDLNEGGIVVNAGNITGTGGYGVLLGLAGTVVNAGTISGGQTAVAFGAGNNRLVVDPGAVFIGAVNNGYVLELGAGAGQSTLAGIGTSFTGFNTIDFDGGATWMVTGDVAGFEGDSVSGFAIVDTLDVTDLDVSGPSTVTADSAGVISILQSGGGSLDLTFSSAYDDDVFTLTPDGAGGTDITEFHGYTYSNIYGSYQPGFIYPYGINDAGEVVGSYLVAENTTGAFMVLDGTFTNFGPATVGGTSVSGYYPAGINDSGEIAGWLIRTDGPRIPFTYEDGTLTTFGLAAGTLATFGNLTVTGINESGAVAGYYNGYSSAGFAEEDTVFLYENGTFTSLGNPSAEVQDLQTAGINNSGEIVGSFFDRNTNTDKGFIYNNGSYTTLSGPSGTYWVEATGINDSGEVVGVFDTPPEVHGQPAEGFIYNNGTYTTLSGPPGALQVVPVAINDSGEVAGYYVLPDGFTEYGFVYQNGTYTTIADPTGTNGSPGVIVNDVVTGPNNNGDVIGYYAMAGTEYAFVADPACFAAGTRIQTPRGKIAVEKLKIGDKVVTAGGDSIPVRWIGVSTVASGGDPLRVMPVRIRAGALGEKIPERDLLLSPDHALFLGGILVQAGALVNGSSITREMKMPRGFIYYHVEVANHELILAEGAAAETFVDNLGRIAFDNWAEHIALYGGETEIAEMRYPRAKSARQLPAALRRLMAQRAALIGEGTLAPRDGALEKIVAGQPGEIACMKGLGGPRDIGPINMF